MKKKVMHTLRPVLAHGRTVIVALEIASLAQLVEVADQSLIVDFKTAGPTKKRCQQERQFVLPPLLVISDTKMSEENKKEIEKPQAYSETKCDAHAEEAACTWTTGCDKGTAFPETRCLGARLTSAMCGLAAKPPLK